MRLSKIRIIYYYSISKYVSIDIEITKVLYGHFAWTIFLYVIFNVTLLKHELWIASIPRKQCLDTHESFSNINKTNFPRIQVNRLCSSYIACTMFWCEVTICYVNAYLFFYQWVYFVLNSQESIFRRFKARCLDLNRNLIIK